MDVVCINIDAITIKDGLGRTINKSSIDDLILYRSYNIIKEAGDSYLILNESGREIYYHQDRFNDRNKIINEILK